MKLPDRWRELSPLLDEMLELAPSSRAPRLEALRLRDPALAEALSQTLAVAEKASRRAFLEQSPSLSGAAQDDDSTEGRAGQRIGPYALEFELGRGGSGTVWKAARVDGQYDGVVAIKLVNPDVMGRTGMARFQREGAILSRLTHPNIARLMDAGVTHEGQPYLVLEYVDGKPIDVHCDEQRLNVADRLRLVQSVMRGVSHAHGQLVVHRDIKPSNILVTSDGEVKLLDFGIAKLLQEDVDNPDLTAEGRAVMTPRYAAPEQLAGQLISTATDVYALGVLMYRLLVGRYPTSNESATAREVITGTLTGEPRSMSGAFSRGKAAASADIRTIAAARGASVRHLQSALRGDLDAISAKALRMEPCERYASVADFSDDIGRYLEHKPVAARTGSTRYRAGKFLRRHRVSTVASALLALSIAAGIFGTTSQARRAEQERDVALHELKSAESTREFVQFLLSEGSDERPIAPALLERGEQLIAREFASDPEEHARLLLLVGRLYGEANIQQKAESLMRRAQELAPHMDDANLKVEIRCQLAWQLANNDPMKQSLELFDTAITELRAAPRARAATLAGCLFGRSEARNKAGELKQALADVQEALALVPDPRPDQRAEAILMRARMASIQGKLGDAATAAAQFHRALDDLQAIGRGQTQSSRTLNNNLGLMLYNVGRPLDGSRALARAVEVSTKVGHPDAVAQTNYARALIDVGRPLDAMRATEGALAALTNVQSKPLHAAVSLNGALAWCATGDTTRCRAMIARAQELIANETLDDKGFVPGLKLRLSVLLEQEGDLRGARTALSEAADTFETLHHRSQMKALALLARVELRLGDIQAAQAHAQEAVALAKARKDGFAHTSWLGSALLSEALVQQARGNASAAAASLNAALIELRDACGDDAPETIAARRALLATARQQQQ